MVLDSARPEISTDLQEVYQIRDLRKVFRQGAVLANDGITLDIRRGEIFGLFGPNGAGKTTLIRQMVGLLKPSSFHLAHYLHRPGVPRLFCGAGDGSDVA
jgi:ABC-type glutathione transport system ATPase component